MQVNSRHDGLLDIWHWKHILASPLLNNFGFFHWSTTCSRFCLPIKSEHLFLLSHITQKDRWLGSRIWPWSRLRNSIFIYWNCGILEMLLAYKARRLAVGYYIRLKMTTKVLQSTRCVKLCTVTFPEAIYIVKLCTVNIPWSHLYHKRMVALGLFL